MSNKVFILGVSIDKINSEELLDQINRRISSRQKTFIATVNPEFIMAAQRDAQFQNLLNEADFAVADGIGLLWAATYLAHRAKVRIPGLRSIYLFGVAIFVGLNTLFSRKVRQSVIPEQITGVDLSYRMAALAASQGYKIFLLGEKPGVAERASQELCRLNPALQIAGVFAGDGSPAGDNKTRQELAGHPAEIALIAYGAPKQEYWIARNLSQIPVYVAMGVGGTFMYISGQTRRAPRWVRRVGAEWLFRLVTQPWRWRRQLALLRFVLAVVKLKIDMTR